MRENTGGGAATSRGRPAPHVELRQAAPPQGSAKPPPSDVPPCQPRAQAPAGPLTLPPLLQVSGSLLQERASQSASLGNGKIIVSVFKLVANSARVLFTYDLV